MCRSFVHCVCISLSFSLSMIGFSAPLRAQLVPKNISSQQSSQQQQPTTMSQQPVQNSSASAKPSGPPRLSQEIQLTGDQYWQDTSIDIQPGERVILSASGTLRYADAKADNGPEGLTRSFKDLIRVLPFNAAGRGALIGRIGDKDTTQAFLVGAKRDLVAPVGGRLSLGINQASSDSGDGTYAVRIEIYPPDAHAAITVVRQVKFLPGIDNALFSKIPRRIADKDGNPGDMVNFLILGSEDAMKGVFATAGWVKVDPDAKDSFLRGVIGTLSKEAYLTMPMSQLYLFGRPQDYGWAHAEPISVVASRNHLRVWKAPFQINGQTLWVGAATHDIGFEKDNRSNGGITHKIDPNIDLERDYVEKTLASTGQVSEISYFTPENPLQEAKTATGGSFHSNGQVLILKLADTNRNLATNK